MNPFESSCGEPLRVPLKGRQVVGESQGAAAPVLKLEQFMRIPILDFGQGMIGSQNSAVFVVQNDSLLTQELLEDTIPRSKGFFLHDHEANPAFQRHARAGQPWRLLMGPKSSAFVRVTWEPTRPGSCRETMTLRWEGKHRLQIVLLGTGTLYQSRKVSKLCNASSPQRPLGLLPANIRPVGPKLPRPTSTKAQSPKLNQQNPRYLAEHGRRSLQADRRDGKDLGGAQALQFRVRVRQSGGLKSALQFVVGKRTVTGDKKGKCGAGSQKVMFEPVRSEGGAGDAKNGREDCSAVLGHRLGRLLSNDSSGAFADKSKADQDCGPLSVKRQLYIEQDESDSGEDEETLSNANRMIGKPQHQVVPISASSFAAQAPNTQHLTQMPCTRGSKRTRVVRRSLPSSSSTEVSMEVISPRRRLNLRSGNGQRSGPLRESSEKRTVSFFHGDLWMEKQMRAYAAWLNHLLAEPLQFVGGQQNMRVAGLQDRRMSLGQLGRLRAEERVRQKLWFAYAKDERTVSTMIRVEKHIDAGHLRMLDGCPIISDIALRSKALQTVLSYDPFWLRLGLEAVLGSSAKQAPHVELQEVLWTRLLHDPHLAAEYASNKQVDGLYRPGYEEAIGRSILKKFLLLVLLLDRVQEALRGSMPLPLLFRKEGDVKRSACAVREFLSGCLSGEGDVLRHLAALGYHLTHEQAAVYEVDFQVSNLAVDLRDGLRLARLAHLLTGDPTPLQDVRVPSSNRAACLHNCQLALTALAHGGLPLGAHGPAALQLTAADVVDGRRDRTLQLLWQIMLHWQVPSLIEADKLREEIELIRRQQRVHQLIHGSSAGVDDSASMYMASTHLDLLLQWTQAVCRLSGVAVRNFTTSFADGRALCLLVSHYLPALLSPEDIFAPPEAVLSPFQEAPADGHVTGWSASYSGGDDECSAVEAAKTVAARRNFALAHSAIAQLGGVPQVLEHSDMTDGNLAPNERIVITYVTFLCSRLLDVKTEAKAATLLQRAWRRHHRGLCLRRWIAAATRIQAVFRGHRTRMDLQRQAAAASRVSAHWRGLVARRSFAALKAASLTIQRSVRAWEARRLYAELHVIRPILHRGLDRLQSLRRSVYERKMTGPAIAIQAAFRGAMQRGVNRRMHAAATVVQARWRSHSATCRFQRHRAAAIRIQAVARGLFLRRHVARMHWAALVVQTEWRRWQAQATFHGVKKHVVRLQAVARGRRERALFVKARADIVRFQAVWRGTCVRRANEKAALAAVRIQAAWRAHSHRRAFLRHVAGIRVLQATWRAYEARAGFLRLRWAAVRLQSHFRGRTVRLSLAVQKAAARCIQAVWRGGWVRIELTHMRAAAILIQSQWRGVLQRRQFGFAVQRIVAVQSAVRRFLAVLAWGKQKRAVVMIQAAYRGHVVRRDVSRAHAAALVVQRHWRGHVQKGRFQKAVRNVTRVQAFVRGWAARRKLVTMHAAAARIQSAYKGHVARRELARAQSSAALVQLHWRGYLQRQRFREAVRGVTRVQALVRGWAARRALKMATAAAVCIQAVFRGHVARRRLVGAHLAARRIQSRWDTHLQRQRFKQAVRRVTRVQALVKGWVARRALRRATAAAVCIQAVFRGHVARGRLVRAHSAARRIQTRWGTFLQRQRFKEAIRSVTRVQAAVRGWAVRTELQKERTAAVRIQALYRGHVARSALTRAHSAAGVIQRQWVAVVHKRKFKHTVREVTRVQACVRRWAVRKELDRQRTAAVRIQAVYKGHVARDALARAHLAATAIQSQWRRFSQRRRFQEALRCVVTVQAAVRSWLGVENLRRVRRAVVACQAVWRGARARAQFLQKRRATVLIQSHYRGFSRRADFERVRVLVVGLQARLRMVLARRSFVALLGAAVSCQALRRGGLVRRSLRESHCSATTIQAFWRGHKARRVLTLQAQAAVVIQSYLRGRSSRVNFLLSRQRFIRLQALIRGRQARQSFERLRSAAVVCQSLWRGKCARVNVLQLRAAVHIQATWRGLRVRKVVQGWNRGAVCIQRYVRGDQERRRYAELKWATVFVQSRVRGALARRRFLALTRATVRMQACWRGRVIRVRQARCTAAAIRIQTHVRGFGYRRAFLKLRDAATLIQVSVKAHLATVSYKRLRIATIALQSVWRGRAARQQFARERASRKVQAFWRGASARARIRVWHAAATVVCRMWRGRRQRETWLRLRGAAVKAQAVYRGENARQLVRIAHSRATVVQSLWRRRVAGQELARLHARQAAAVCVQKNWRAHCLRRRFTAARMAAVAIQSAWKMHRECALWARRRTALVTLQAFWRGVLARRQLARDAAMTTAGRAAIKVQRAWRKYVAAREWRARRLAAALVIQRKFRAALVRVRFVRLRAAVLKLQSLWRGHVVRRTNTTRQRAVRQRIARATARLEAPMTLGSRTSAALRVLLASKQVSQALHACAAIDMSTRLSPVCCERIAANSAVPTLLRFIQSCNRSTPHVQLLRHGLSILRNLCKHRALVGYVVEAPDCVNILVEQLQMYRDKEDVFNLALETLLLICRDAQRAQTIREMPEIVNRLTSIASILSRKAQLDPRPTGSSKQVASLRVLLQKLRPPSVVAHTPLPVSKRRAFISVGTPGHGLVSKTPFRDLTNVRPLKFKHQD